MKKHKRVMPAKSEQIIDEDLISLSVNYQSKAVSVLLGLVDENGVANNARSVNITGEWYDLLMTKNPKWAKGKPSGEFRTDDVFYVIDAMQS